MDRATAERIIHPHREKLVATYLAGHADVSGLPADYLASLEDRSRFGNIRDRIKHHMILNFGAKGPVRWMQMPGNPQLEFLYIEASPEPVVIRVKKGDRFNALTSNSETEYQNELRANQYLSGIGDAPDAAHLFGVYTEDGNEIGQQIERLLITCEYRSGGKNTMDWWFELYRADGLGTLPIPLASGYEQQQIPAVAGFAGTIKPKRPAAATLEPEPLRPPGAKTGSEPGSAQGGERRAADGA